MSERPHASPETARAGESSIMHFPLEQVLPTGEVLAVHRELGIAAILTSDGERPRMLAAQLFPPMEKAMLLRLVFSHPEHAPNELLLASFSGGSTEKEIEQARKRLLRAKECGEWDMLMRPMRNSLARVRQKIITLHVDVRSIFETGYTLIPYTEGQYRRMRRHWKGRGKMNQEEREAFTQQTTQRMVASLRQTTNGEETIRSLLAKYGRAMFAAGVRTMEEWIRRSVASLPIPIVITRTDHGPVLAYHWQSQDREDDGVTLAYCLEQALTHLMSQQGPS